MRAALPANTEVLPKTNVKPHCLGRGTQIQALLPVLPNIIHDPSLDKRPYVHIIQGRRAFRTGQWPLKLTEEVMLPK